MLVVKTPGFVDDGRRRRSAAMVAAQNVGDSQQFPVARIDKLVIAFRTVDTVTPGN